MTYLGFQTEGPTGYDVRFLGRGSERAQRAQVWTEKGRDWAEWTTVDGELFDAKVGDGTNIVIYDLDGTRSVGPRLEVEMGSLGRFSARFHASGEVVSRRPCVTVRSRSGRLAGELRFAGEGGYAGLDEHRVRARLVTVDRRCGDRNAREIGHALRAAGRWRRPSLLACGPTSRLALAASRGRYFGDFFAVKADRTEAARITRIASVTRFTDSFSYRRDLESARLRPDPPFFRGEARYTDGSLTGSLRARFPGVGWTALTPGEADLFRSDPEPLPCAKVFDFLNRSVMSSRGGRLSAVGLRSRLAPPLPRPTVWGATR